MFFLLFFFWAFTVAGRQVFTYHFPPNITLSEQNTRLRIIFLLQCLCGCTHLVINGRNMPLFRYQYNLWPRALRDGLWNIWDLFDVGCPSVQVLLLLVDEESYLDKWLSRVKLSRKSENGYRDRVVRIVRKTPVAAEEGNIRALGTLPVG